MKRWIPKPSLRLQEVVRTVRKSNSNVSIIRHVKTGIYQTIPLSRPKGGGMFLNQSGCYPCPIGHRNRLGRKYTAKEHNNFFGITAYGRPNAFWKGTHRYCRLQSDGCETDRWSVQIIYRMSYKENYRRMIRCNKATGYAIYDCLLEAYRKHAESMDVSGITDRDISRISRIKILVPNLIFFDQN
ncbi:hypothetical protein GGQ57_003947 [Parabacteroides faecis]|uniref:Uncharacterized protein n=1 Tax=Parabacteroides faecis TaxID=1217282 RepID=A0ABR6KRL4_9BACT|nr:hypothetical protein [Parabacteroides faecis]